MALPASYTEKTLAQFMHTQLGKIASILGLAVGASDAGSYAEAVNDTLLAYDAEDVTTITGAANLKKLRALAMLAAWTFVINNFAALYDFSADGASYDRSQLFKQSKEALVQDEIGACQGVGLPPAKGLERLHVGLRLAFPVDPIEATAHKVFSSSGR